MAINALNGGQIWKQAVELPADFAKYTSCGLINRGVAILNGKVYCGTFDAHMIAYDAKTGKQLW